MSYGPEEHRYNLQRLGEAATLVNRARDILRSVEDDAQQDKLGHEARWPLHVAGLKCDSAVVAIDKSVAMLPTPDVGARRVSA